MFVYAWEWFISNCIEARTIVIPTIHVALVSLFMRTNPSPENELIWQGPLVTAIMVHHVG